MARFARSISIRLVGDHPLQFGLVRLIGDHPGVKLVLPFARFGRENVPGESMLPDNLPRPGLLEPFGRTFMGLQFGHEKLFRETCILTQGVAIVLP